MQKSPFVSANWLIWRKDGDMKFLIGFISFAIGAYIGTELQAWWHRDGARKFVKKQLNDDWFKESMWSMSMLKSGDSCRRVDQPDREKAAYIGCMRWGCNWLKRTGCGDGICRHRLLVQLRESKNTYSVAVGLRLYVRCKSLPHLVRFKLVQFFACFLIKQTRRIQLPSKKL